MLCSLLILFTRNDTLQKIICILVLELVRLILIAQGVAESERVLQHAAARTFQANLVLDDDFE